MKKQKGFTLIELIVVIVILGILAAFAIPKYMQLDKKARIATVKGLEGSIKSASILVHSVAKAAKSTGETVTSNVNIGDSNVTINSTTLYPTGNTDGIIAAMEDVTGFTVSATDAAATFQRDDATTAANCSVTYNVSTGTPDISSDTSGC